MGAVAFGYKSHGAWHLPSGGQWLGIGWGPAKGGGGGGAPPPVYLSPSCPSVWKLVLELQISNSTKLQRNRWLQRSGWSCSVRTEHCQNNRKPCLPCAVPFTRGPLHRPTSPPPPCPSPRRFCSTDRPMRASSYYTASRSPCSGGPDRPRHPLSPACAAALALGVAAGALTYALAATHAPPAQHALRTAPAARAAVAPPPLQNVHRPFYPLPEGPAAFARPVALVGTRRPSRPPHAAGDTAPGTRPRVQGLRSNEWLLGLLVPLFIGAAVAVRRWYSGPGRAARSVARPWGSGGGTALEDVHVPTGCRGGEGVRWALLGTTEAAAEGGIGTEGLKALLEKAAATLVWRVGGAWGVGVRGVGCGG